MPQRLFLALLAILFNTATVKLHAQPSSTNFNDKEVERILTVAQSNIEKLGLKALSNTKSGITTLIYNPVKEKPTFQYFTTTLISNFADHNPTYGVLEDYHCGTRTYDGPAGGHRGTDWTVNPFKWKLMDNEMVAVVAAATGVIVLKEDGHYDRNHNAPDSASNSVVLWHPADESKALYLHLKKYSLTSKNVGDTVYGGEFIGYIGSSGVSTGPHLHFEIRDASNNSIDPFYGPCNKGIQTSWWANQHPYYDTDILSITTHTKLVDWGNNKNDTEITYESDNFMPGDSLKLYAFLRSYYPGDTFQIKVFRPDGSLFYAPTKVGTTQFYSTYYMYRSTKLSPSDPQGVWRVEGTLISGNQQVGTIVKNKYFCVGQAPEPKAAFNTSVSGLTVYCANTSTNAKSYIWLFGDGLFSKEESPSYTYNNHGNYNVCLVASNGCSSDTVCANVITNIKNFQTEKATISLFPNPANSYVTANIASAKLTSGGIMLYNIYGHKVREIEDANNAKRSYLIDLTDLSAGIYFVVAEFETGRKVKRLVISR